MMVWSLYFPFRKDLFFWGYIILPTEARANRLDAREAFRPRLEPTGFPVVDADEKGRKLEGSWTPSRGLCDSKVTTRKERTQGNLAAILEELKDVRFKVWFLLSIICIYLCLKFEDGEIEVAIFRGMVCCPVSDFDMVTWYDLQGVYHFIEINISDGP